MSVIQSIIKMFNGSEWDEYHPKTDAEQVTYDDNGTETTVQDEIAALKSNQRIYGVRKRLSYVSALEMSTTITFPESIAAATATFMYISSGAWTQASAITVVVSGKKATVRAHGTGFVSSHILDVYVTAVSAE